MLATDQPHFTIVITEMAVKLCAAYVTASLTLNESEAILPGLLYGLE